MCGQSKLIVCGEVPLIAMLTGQEELVLQEDGVTALTP